MASLFCLFPVSSHQMWVSICTVTSSWVSWCTYFKGHILKGTLAYDNIYSWESLGVWEIWNSFLSTEQLKEQGVLWPMKKRWKSTWMVLQGFEDSLDRRRSSSCSSPEYKQWRSDCDTELSNIKMRTLWSCEFLEKIPEGWDV